MNVMALRPKVSIESLVAVKKELGKAQASTTKKKSQKNWFY